MRYLEKNLQDPAKAHDWVIDDFKPIPTDTDNAYRYLSKRHMKTDRKYILNIAFTLLERENKIIMVREFLPM